MAALSFPTSPTNGQIVGDYQYDSTYNAWRSIAQYGSLPCGAVIPWPSATIPGGWLLCDGSAVSRTTYSSLYAALGGLNSPWGQGDGSTTFNVPDMRGKTLVGKNSGTFSTLAATGGAESFTLSASNLPQHMHGYSGSTNTTGDHYHAPPITVTYNGNAGNDRRIFTTNSGLWSGGDYYNATTTNGAHSHTFSGTTDGGNGSGSAFGIVQPYAVTNYIIKTTVQIAATDTELAVRVGTAENTVNGYNTRLQAVETNATIMSGQMGSIGTISGAQKIAFDDFWVSRGITYDSTTRRFTVPKAGVYRITMTPFQNSSVQSRVLVGVNTDAPTSANHRGMTFTNSTGYNQMGINSIVSLNANDYIVFYLYEGALYNATSDRFNQFSIERISS